MADGTFPNFGRKAKNTQREKAGQNNNGQDEWPQTPSTGPAFSQAPTSSPATSRQPGWWSTASSSAAGSMPAPRYRARQDRCVARITDCMIHAGRMIGQQRCLQRATC